MQEVFHAYKKDTELVTISDSFNKVRMVRPHQALPKIHQKVAPPNKKLFYFFIVAPGRRWMEKRKKC